MSTPKNRSGTAMALLAACVLLCSGTILGPNAPAQDNRARRSYQVLWERQSMRDALKVVPTGQVRRPARAVERKVINQQILRSINKQIRRQTLSGAGRAEQLERRQQIRERVDLLMEKRKERMKEKLEQFREEQQKQRQQQLEQQNQQQEKSGATTSTIRQTTTDPLTSFTDRRISAVSTDPAGETATTAPPPPQRAPTLTRDQRAIMQDMRETMDQMKETMDSDMDSDTTPTTDLRVINTDTRPTVTDTRDTTPTTDIRNQPPVIVEPPIRVPPPTITPAPTPTRPPTTDVRDDAKTSDTFNRARRSKVRR